MKLYDFQQEGADRIRRQRRVLLTDDMGIGKTPQVIMGLSDAKKVLVSCPNSVKSAWAEKLAQWVPHEQFVVIESQKDAERVRGPEKWVIVSHESIRLKEPEKGGAKRTPSTIVGKQLFQTPFDAFVLDEAHLLVNRKSQGYVGARALSKCRYVIPMTGTPQMNNVADYWSLLHLVNPKKWSSFWAFVKKYANARPGRFGWEWDKFSSNYNELVRDTADDMIRRVKTEVGLAVPRTTETVYLEPTAQQLNLFDSICNDQLYDTGEEIRICTNPLVTTTFLRQASVDPYLIVPTYSPSDPRQSSPKIRYVVDYVKSSEERVVVFSMFSSLMDRLKLAFDLEKIDVKMFTGKEQADARKMQLHDFQNGEGKAILVTIPSGGPGIDITKASVAMFLDRHWNPAMNSQAEARIDRIGQENDIKIINLMTVDSIDNFVYDTISTKQDGIDSFDEALRQYNETRKKRL